MPKNTKSTKKTSRKSKADSIKPDMNLTRQRVSKILAFVKPLDAIYITLVFASIPALTFWTKSNTDELGIEAMKKSFLAIWLVSLLIFGFWYLVFRRDRYKALILSLFTVVISFNYGQVFSIYRRGVKFVFQLSQPPASDAFLLLVLVALALVLAVFVHRKISLSKIVRNYLLLVATALLVINVYPLLKNWPSEDWKKDTSFGSPIISDANVENKPSIYYIVPDRYASNETLKNVYGFDNKKFLESLEERGFYVADKAVANYPFTRMSLSSSLNVRYFPDSYVNSEEMDRHYRLLQHKLEDNKVAQFLKNQNYEFINIGPWWDPTKYNRNADQDRYYPSGVVLFGNAIDLKEQELLILQDTVFWRFFQRNITLGGKRLFTQTVIPGKESTGRVVHRNTIHHQLENMKEVSKQEGPKFVFMHMLFPHDPYVLDENCNIFKEKYTDEYKVYLNQLKCANTKFLEVIDDIRQNDKNAIIVIQADEGPYPKTFRADKDNYEWKTASTEDLQHKSRILNAYYFPDGNYKNLYEHITPVNTFRVILSQYFDTKLELLEDINYFPESVKKRFFLFDVTDKVRPE